MDSKYQPTLFEKEIYSFWEKEKIFEATTDKAKKPFCIVLPPPNANADLHAGHAMMVYEDIMIRYHKLIGDSVYFVAGADHAGFETQYVFEKHLAKSGKSRFDYDRDTLYKMIWDFVIKNKGNMEEQLKRLGFGLDWSKRQFTLDKKIISIVYKTFEHLFNKGLIYRSDRLVNYCTHCGTSFSDLEVKHVERKDPLYYLKYGPFVLATVRPETKFGDTAVAVHPKDKRYKKWVGQDIEVEGLLGKFKIKVIADNTIDPKFGTGAAKVTPAHDFKDFEMAKKHNLEFKEIINKEGKLTKIAGQYAGLRVQKARQIVADDLMKKGLLEKIDTEYIHTVATCYRCGRVLEPLMEEQWYIKIKPLANQAIELVKKDKIVVYPKRFKRQLIRILDEFIDWNISRQIVWGIRIPAYRCIKQNKWFVDIEGPIKCKICGDCSFQQDSDTFDTWFSSAQWPFATLRVSLDEKGYQYYYPTSVMETGYDILRAWVARMIMIGYFETGSIPFQTVFLHGMVRDKKGQKMSKSKGNVINPLEMIDKYGADALRAALLFGTKEGNDVVLSEEKIIGMRNFANKLWNIGRFIKMNLITNKQLPITKQILNSNNKIIEKLQKEFIAEKKKYMSHMKKNQFAIAFETTYQFVWHKYADQYIELLKESIINGNIKTLEVLSEVFYENLKMLHPFMPFVTEALWKVFHGEKDSILYSRL